MVNGRSHAWWPLECSMLGGHWNVKEKTPFHLFHFLLTTLLTPSIFPLDPMVLLYQGPKPSLTPFFLLLRSINYDCASPCNKFFTSSLSTWFWLKIWPFLFLEFMTSRTIASYGPQATQANEEPLSESTLLLVTNPRSFAKVVTKPKILLSSHGLQFPALVTIVGCAARSVDCLPIARRTT